MKAQRLPSDIITTLPQCITETILCLLPIEEAARTSILSREWRFKWTKIPKLVFHDSTVKTSAEERHLSHWNEISDLERKRRKKDMRCKLFYAILQVLLQRQGPIHEFTLSMYHADRSCFEIDQIILHLSRNHTIKKLTLELHDNSPPLSLFSLHQLTDLYLDSCVISHKPIFNGFGSLTTLSLRNVMISTESFLHLLSNCPSLKSLYLFMDEDWYLGDSVIPILEFFKCVFVIEHLTISRCFSEYAIQASVPKELLTSQMHLKHFCFKEMRNAETEGWIFLSTLIKCSPKLEKIKLEMCEYNEECGEGSVTFEEYSDVWLEHLNELEIEDYINLKPELEFVKVILTKSPNLKKVKWLTCMRDKNEELEMLNILLSAPRISPVQIIVKNRYKPIDDD